LSKYNSGVIFIWAGARRLLVQSRVLIKALEEAGWRLDRVTGSHHLFTHRYNPYTIPVPHPKKDLPLGTVRSIRRRAGLLYPLASYAGDP
jgi:predicted RNA binding protein YcfA (HicA-like mRNA interferase family)